MGSLYTQGFSTVAAASGAAYCTFHTGASRVARIRELGLSVNAATASSFGLIRPSNTPVASTSVLVLPEDPTDPAGTVNVDTAWSTAPTIGTVFLRKFTVPAVIGNGVIWTWNPGEELIINLSAYLVLWNFGAGAGSVLNGYIKLIEGA
jgi:hypothetical protein